MAGSPGNTYLASARIKSDWGLGSVMLCWESYRPGSDPTLASHWLGAAKLHHLEQPMCLSELSLLVKWVTHPHFAELSRGSKKTTQMHDWNNKRITGEGFVENTDSWASAQADGVRMLAVAP